MTAIDLPDVGPRDRWGAKLNEAIATLAADVVTETTARGAADTALQAALDAESAGREAADGALADDLNDESVTRGAAVAALQTALTLKASRPGATAVLLGTSFMQHNDEGAQGTGSVNYSSRGFFHHANTRLRQRLRVLDYQGVGGETSAQILARVAACTALAPAWVITDAAVNDVLTAVPYATTIANLKALYAALRAAGARVIVPSLPPYTGLSAVPRKNQHAINRWMSEYCAVTPGMVYVDWTARLTDPASGDYNALYSYDGVHFSALGAAAAGKKMAEVLEPLMPLNSGLPVTSADTNNLLSNGCMTGNAGGLATGWTLTSGGAGATPSKVPRSDAILGEWQQIVLDGTGTPQLYSYNPNVGVDWNVGDVIYGLVEFECDNNLLTPTAFEFICEAVTNVGGAIANGGASVLKASGADGLQAPIEAGVARTAELTIPATTGRVQIRVQIAGTTGTYRIGRAAIYKKQVI